MEDMEKLEEKIPETHKKSWIVGGIGGIIGGVIGGYISVIKGSSIYGGIGVGIGIVVGEAVGLLINKKVPLKPLLNIERNINIFGGVLSLLLAIAGIIGFFLTGKWVGIVGAIFFGLCGIYLLKISRNSHL